MADENADEVVQFHEMGLDDRLLKAIARLNWSSPTPIQEKAIPLGLKGKDILARARTGSGKTAAYAIPIIQKVLQGKISAKEQCVKAVILTPTKELCSQAFKNIQELCADCSRDVKCADVSSQVALDVQRPQLMERPDIVVGTPSRVLAHVVAGNLRLKDSVEMLVIDEADLVLSFGYDNDIKQLLSHMPKIYQAFLTSATLSDDVKTLKSLVLHNPVTLRLEESQLPSADQLTQYHIRCEEEDKFVLIYALRKLRLIRGKMIIFVNSTDRCYRLKLYLEQFGIVSCIINSELPASSRCHVISQFNEGLYDIVIAADEKSVDNQVKAPKSSDAKKPPNKKQKKDKESGISRGIDFHNITVVINFDFPLSVDAYVHRVGRTARGDTQGTTISFVSLKELPLLEKVEKALAGDGNDAESIFKPFSFRMEEIDGFRYRARDAMRAVTSVAVREARLKEIKAEMMNSQKLKSHFEDNPRDLQVLRHDKNLNVVKSQPHLKHVPEYLVPSTLKRMRSRGSTRPAGAGDGTSGGAKPSSGEASSSSRYHQQSAPKGQAKYQKRQADPLKSFQFTGFQNKRQRRK